MAAVNLIRNARVFFTYNVNAETGKLTSETTGFSTANTREIKVLDGLSFSQNSTTESVSINESGTAPVRGTKVFNTALEAVDFSFSTYVSPILEDGDAQNEATDYVDAEENVLWNAFTSQAAIGDKVDLLDVAGWVKTAGLTADRVSTVTFAHSNKNFLQRFALIIIMDDTTYLLENCALESVALDFGIDAIATLQWTGKAVSFKTLASNVTVSAPDANNQVAFSGGLTATAVLAKVPTSKCRYLANKLSTVKITEVSKITGGTTQDPAAKSWTIPITGGNLTINNNLTYLTPAAMGVVNKPFTYFTGARTMTGSLTAYLRAGAGFTGELLTNALANSEVDDTNQYKVELSIGGTSSASTRVDLIMNTAMLSVPTIATEQVVSTTIGFTPQGAATLEDTDEVVIKYYAA